MIESFTFTDIKNDKMIDNYVRCDKIFSFVPEMPLFNGDQTGREFKRYIQSNIKYPENAQKNKIEENIYIQYVVDKNGYTGDVKVVRGENEELKSAALAAFENVPKFDSPGKNNGIPVCTKCIVTITFKLK
ncbi:MAG: energy transducer TonB [Cytophagaceae bacterium]|jgi:TonB family protein|nr:energy transducer TonB [Cytophagaceae bacterium]